MTPQTIKKNYSILHCNQLLKQQQFDFDCVSVCNKSQDVDEQYNVQFVD